MDLNNIKAIFFEDINTFSDVDILMRELSNLKSLLFTNFNNINELLSNQISVSLSQKFKRAFGDFNSINSESITQVIDTLESYVSKAKVLNLVIAITPNNSLIKKITAWARKESNDLVFINLKYNPEIYGGAIIEFNNIYKDYSLSRVANV